MRRSPIAGAVALILVGTGLAAPVAAQSSGIARTDLSRNDLAGAGREALQVLVEFDPGVVAAPHSHPGEELVYVVYGSLEYRLDGRAPVVLEAGDTLFIPAGAVHEVANVGAGRSAELATYIVEKARPLVIPAD